MNSWTPRKGTWTTNNPGVLEFQGIFAKAKTQIEAFWVPVPEHFFFVGDCWRIDGDGDGQIPQQTSIKTLSIFISNSSENRKNHPPNSKRVNLLSDFSHLCLES